MDQGPRKGGLDPPSARSVFYPVHERDVLLRPTPLLSQMRECWLAFFLQCGNPLCQIAAEESQHLHRK